MINHMTEFKIKFQINSEINKFLKFIFQGTTYDIKGDIEKNDLFVEIKIYDLEKNFPGLYTYSFFIKDTKNNCK